MRAPKSGELAGFVIVDKQDWANPVVRESVIQGGVRLYFEGILYVPEWRDNISGNGGINQQSPCVGTVGDHFYMEGNGTLYVVSQCKTAGIPNLMPKIKSGPTMLW